MADWNPLLYLKFSGERTRPAEDLAGSLPLRAPARVLDIGCGPGNSTAVLSRRFPAAELLGVDASPAMVRQAQAAFPQWAVPRLHPARRAQGAGRRLGRCVLKRMPAMGAGHPAAHPRFVRPALSGRRACRAGAPAGQAAVHRLLKQLALSPRWRGKIRRPRAFYNLAPKEYFILLGGLTPGIPHVGDHLLPNHGEPCRHAGLVPQHRAAALSGSALPHRRAAVRGRCAGRPAAAVPVRRGRADTVPLSAAVLHSREALSAAGKGAGTRLITGQHAAPACCGGTPGMGRRRHAHDNREKMP